MKKQKKTRNEIRVTDIPDEIFEMIKKDAKENLRSLSKEIVFNLKKIYNK
jgi:hypothetical protein